MFMGKASVIIEGVSGADKTDYFILPAFPAVPPCFSVTGLVFLVIHQESFMGCGLDLSGCAPALAC